MTIGHSKTVEAFLKNAARKRKFTVIVAETAPSSVASSRSRVCARADSGGRSFSGRNHALALSAAGIPTILIPDSNIFALLPRCTKVLLGPHIILADGALLSISGSLPLCLAANRMRVPVVAVGGMFKFSPVYLGEADWGMRDLGSPEEVLQSTDPCVQLPAHELARMGGAAADDAADDDETEVLNPYYDVVPNDLVNLYISNLCVHRLSPRPSHADPLLARPQWRPPLLAVVPSPERHVWVTIDCTRAFRSLARADSACERGRLPWRAR